MTVLFLAPFFIASAAAEPMRAVQVDLDYVYDQDPAQTERNLDALVERIAAIHPAALFLQAFADPKGSGLASQTYFPNRQVPMRANLFGEAVQAFKERTNVKVFGWLPVLSFDFGDKVALVEAWDPATGNAAPDAKAYRRASPFDQIARTRIAEIYEDMALSAPIDGILFHDDATLSDFEDASPAALKAARAAGLPGSVKDLRADAKTLKAWTNFKTGALIKFTKILASHVRRYRPDILTARNIYAPVMLDPQSRAWFAQDYDKFLKAYDYTAVEAMPRMEKIADADAEDWLKKLIGAGARRAAGLQRTVFELQAVDWNLAAEGKQRAIPAETLAAELRVLTEAGAQNVAYYPDDFVTDTPKLALLRKDFSLQTGTQTP
jgi:poly-beta-1,6-N-acetyl-D-glucosamine N-deacetylase